MTKAHGPAEFALSISSLGPFELSPHIAVACSGGPDSLALTLLADGWARDRGGRATALIVDHAMRPESASEAAAVRERLITAGVEAVVLTRDGPDLKSDRQAAARRARYALMTEWCRQSGVLHLLLGHHQGDQAETLMLRLGRGSGVDGLAAMAPISENAHLRLLRPLLGVPRDRLAAYLRSRGVDWVEDPSNEDAAFARVRLRRMLPGLGEEGLTEPRLAATARRMARARVALESAATGLLARATAIYPEGYAMLAHGELLAAPEEIGLRALARLLTCIGGGQHGPRLERLERLYEWLARGDGGGRTLAGCRIVRRGAGLVLVCREAAATGEAVPAADGAVWDGRFRLSTDSGHGAMVRRLGPDGWAQIKDRGPNFGAESLPAEVRNAIPAIWRLEEVAAIPHLHYYRMPLEGDPLDRSELTFLPARSLGAARFLAVPGFS
jgi:tRNA(Ile)-lysidine synthase